MNDRLPDDARSALDHFASAEVLTPERNRDGILRAVRRRRQGRRAAAGAAAAGLAALVVVWAGNRAAVTASPEKASSVAAIRSIQSTGETTLHVGQQLRSEEMVRIESGSVELELASSRFFAEGPAEFSVSKSSISLTSGSGRIIGSAQVSGCGCNASAEGEATFTAGVQSLQVVVIAGAVHAEPMNVHCQITELEGLDEDDRATSIGEHVAQTNPPQVERLQVASRRAAAQECDLGAQADAYREAMHLRDSDDAGLVAALRRVRRDHRRCPLSHEVDVALIEALLRTGQTAAARREARRFVRRYPRSARRADMERLTSP